jgi:hypothetical protein
MSPDELNATFMTAIVAPIGRRISAVSPAKVARNANLAQMSRHTSALT